MIDMHHIVSDGVSVGIFIKEFTALYGQEEMTPLKSRYRDYVQWRKKKKQETPKNKPPSLDETQTRQEEKY